MNSENVGGVLGQFKFFQLLRTGSQTFERTLLLYSFISGIANAALIAIVNNAADEIEDGQGEIMWWYLGLFAISMTIFYITKKIVNPGVKVTSIARGIPIGGELEYADEITLGRSILDRIEYNQSQ